MIVGVFCSFSEFTRAVDRSLPGPSDARECLVLQVHSVASDLEVGNNLLQNINRVLWFRYV